MIQTITSSTVPPDHDPVAFRERRFSNLAENRKRRKANAKRLPPIVDPHDGTVRTTGELVRCERSARRAANRAAHVEQVRSGELPLILASRARVSTLAPWASAKRAPLPDFDSMTRDALRAAARDLGLPNYSEVRGNKGSLLAAVKSFASKGRR